MNFSIAFLGISESHVHRSSFLAIMFFPFTLKIWDHIEAATHHLTMSANATLSSRFLKALAREKQEDYETSHELLTSTPPKILARNGLALLNLLVENVRTSIGGKLVIDLAVDGAIAPQQSSTKEKSKSKSKSKSKKSSSSKAGSKSQSKSLTSSQPSMTDFRPGDIVKIDTLPTSNKKLQQSSNAADIASAATQIPIEGVITSSTSPTRISVAVTNANSSDDDNSTNSQGKLVTDRIWALHSAQNRVWAVKVSNESTYRRLESTLRKLGEFSIDSMTSQNSPYAPDIVQYLLGTKSYIPPKDEDPTGGELTFENQGMNESQKHAVKFALKAPLTIVHGPPGTGKTSTLVEFILQHLQMYPGKRLLITAASNIAADTILERLSNNSLFSGNSGKLIRLGHPARVLPTTRKHVLDVIVAANGGEELVDIQKEIVELEKEVRKPRINKAYSDRRDMWREIKNLKKELRWRSKKGVRETLIAADVVVATLHGSASWEVVGNIYNAEGATTNGFGSGFFHTVVIDEVSQALEPACWVPIVNHGPKKVVLAGDNKQLPPTIHVSERSDDIDSKHAHKVLSQSLFDRVVRIYGGDESKIPFVKFLDTQYRMCDKCMEFPSNEWYHGKLKAAESVKNGTVMSLLKQYSTEGKKKDISFELEDLTLEDEDDLVEQVIWYDTQGGSCPENVEETIDGINGGSKYNIGECYIVQKHIAHLVKLGVKEEDIGVIAPYNAQVSKLRSLLWNGSIEGDEEQDCGDEITEIYTGIEISTVDGFQGREKEIIILSLVRSNFGDAAGWDSADVGFLSDFRRLNVSITRCKKQLAIIGDMETLERSGVPMLQHWTEWCSDNADIRYVD